MKLELKHLAPYLPYGLEFIDKYESKQGVKKMSILGLDKTITYEWGNSTSWTTINEIRPILRPMSELEDGRQWIDKLQLDCNHAIHYSEGCFFDAYSDEFTIDWLPQRCYEWLVKNHFDVFGLIPAGLAIDINTIDKKTP